MRTTVTLEPDTDAIVRRLMRERGLSFKQALNEAIRSGGRGRGSGRRFKTRTANLGQPAIPVDKALRLAAELEDDELLRRLALRK
jgi:hypothetical protein